MSEQRDKPVSEAARSGLAAMVSAMGAAAIAAKLEITETTVCRAVAGQPLKSPTRRLIEICVLREDIATSWGRIQDAAEGAYNASHKEKRP